MAQPTFVGVDVSKAQLDVAARPGGAPFRLPTDPAGVAALVERLRPLARALVVLEATGGYEAPALAALQLAGIPAAAVNPRQARRFAETTGRLAKTDASTPRHWPTSPRRSARSCGRRWSRSGWPSTRP